ncbi:MAG: flagellar hook-associated protein FlgK [Firmicutes bacterium]|nr:flagellar hook-associated protein FlgK [Bacillota bacterium]
MSGLFATLNTARRGMFAQQAAITTTSHNISNANTEGYSRQRVHLETSLAFSKPGVGQIGTGVDIESIRRVRDRFLDTQIRGEQGVSKEYAAREDVLEQIESIFMEPSDSGLNTMMGRMWNAWQELSKSPENSNAKTIVAQESQAVTDTLNHMYTQMDNLNNNTVELIEKKTFDAKSILTQVDTLNEQIFNVKIKGEHPNDLLDKRDKLLDELSEITNFDVKNKEYGQIEISIGDTNVLGTDTDKEMSVIRSVEKDPLNSDKYKITLVKGGDSLNATIEETIDLSIDSPSFDVTKLKAGDVVFNDPKWDPNTTDIKDIDLETVNLETGSLKGYQSVLNETKGYQDSLNTFANGLAEKINEIHSKTDSAVDTDGDGTDGDWIDFFKSEDGSPINASNIMVNEEIIKDVNKINTGKELIEDNGGEGTPGDGSKALEIAELRNERLINDTTFDAYYKDIVAELGISTQEANRMTTNQETLLGQLETRKESISGVSIDEEVANLVQFQRSYEANSRVISTLSQMLDTLINRTGI